MKKHAEKRHRRVLLSAYDKDILTPLVKVLHELGVEMVSSGGTMRFIRDMGIPVLSVEELTAFPSILDGRVKTLHPAVFGGILCRPEQDTDRGDMQTHGIEAFDMVVVDIYPFEAALARGASHNELIEKIDIGGVSLIRAAAKNFEHVLTVPSGQHFNEIAHLLEQQKGHTSIDDRRRMAAAAMHVSSHYDTAIFNYLDNGTINVFKKSIGEANVLRYGENPHQQGCFYGNLFENFEQLSGKPLSYNNLLDIDAAMALLAEFSEPAFAIIKHNNACGVACRSNIEDAFANALAGDPVSAYGGVFIANRNVTPRLASAINDIFFEVLLAPSYDEESLSLLSKKTKRIILKTKSYLMPETCFRSALNGVLWQTSDHRSSRPGQWQVQTRLRPDATEEQDLVFANSIVKHLKSNAIALVKNSMLLGAGMGQSSRVDALRQAISKAQDGGHDLGGAVMASDAFFPFADCVEIAHNAGIRAVIQPGGSLRDNDSVEYCDNAQMVMVFTGNRHFRH